MLTVGGGSLNVIVPLRCVCPCEFNMGGGGVMPEGGYLVRIHKGEKIRIKDFNFGLKDFNLGPASIAYFSMHHFKIWDSAHKM